MPLLDPDFVARLDRLEILSRKILEGKLRGEHTARKHGPSAEFADHRNYTPGDDPRFIDWNILARLDRLLVKIFLAEQEPFMYLVLDQSKSCDYGQPNKAVYIKQVAAALGFVGLVNHHRVKILALGGGPIKQAGPLHSRFVLPRMIKFIESLRPNGIADFPACCRWLADKSRVPGVCVVLSDFLMQENLFAPLGDLVAARQDLYCIQVLSPQEIEPSGKGPATLTDLETTEQRQTPITPSTVARYQANLAARRQSLADLLARHGAQFIFNSTDVPFDRLILECLRQRGLLA